MGGILEPRDIPARRRCLDRIWGAQRPSEAEGAYRVYGSLGPHLVRLEEQCIGGAGRGPRPDLRPELTVFESAISPRSTDEDRKSGWAGSLVCSSSITENFIASTLWIRSRLRGISGIVQTANGDLWLNGQGGIVHVRRAEIIEALKNSAYRVSGERFGRREGLPGLAPPIRPIPSAIEGTDGRLWFTVNNGVVWLDPARASNKVPPPPVTIQSVSADDKGYRLDSPIRLPAHTSSVQISYAAVSLSDPEAIRFRYKLRETDQGLARSRDVQLRELPQSTSRLDTTSSSMPATPTGYGQTILQPRSSLSYLRSTRQTGSAPSARSLFWHCCGRLTSFVSGNCSGSSAWQPKRA